MKKILTYQAALVIMLINALALSAQDVSVKVQYPPLVAAGQQFSVTWTVNSGGGEFAAPSFAPFYKLMGPQTSYSSSTQIINGRMTQSTNYTYIYYLQAVNEGKFVIPPAVFTLKNKTYTSDSLFIEVAGNNSQQQAASANRTGEEEVESAGRDIFVNLLLSRREIYLG
ncbi:MAG: BatD family protein, partial [Bacteroidales bacterium]|nr:BatD family protein [Bacteroidales bacterium]